MIQIDDGRDAGDLAVDGRAARRARNIDAVLDAVVEMITEGDLFPSIEQVARRSGLSIRSIYRYFADPAALQDAAITRHRERSVSLAHLSSIGQGELEHRVDDFVAMRLRLYGGVGATYRATVHGAISHPRLRDELARNRNDLRAQFERQFAPELETRKGVERDAIVAAGDLLTQLDSIDLLRRHRQLSVAETIRSLRTALLALLKEVD